MIAYLYVVHIDMEVTLLLLGNKKVITVIISTCKCYFELIKLDLNGGFHKPQILKGGPSINREYSNP